MQNEIEVLKKQLARLQGRVSVRLLEPVCNSLRARFNGGQDDVAWGNLYYAQPNAAQAARSYAKHKAAIRHFPADALAQLDPVLDELIVLGGQYASAKAAPKPVRQPRAGNSYAVARHLFVPGNYDGTPRPGDYLLVRYGNGTQCFYVQSVSKAGKPTGYRLFHRGFTYEGWRPSSLRVGDKRIFATTLCDSVDRPLSGAPGVPA